MTGDQLARAAAYIAELRARRDMLAREGFHTQSLTDMEAGASGLLAAMGVDVSWLLKTMSAE